MSRQILKRSPTSHKCFKRTLLNIRQVPWNWAHWLDLHLQWVLEKSAFPQLFANSFEWCGSYHSHKIGVWMFCVQWCRDMAEMRMTPPRCNIYTKFCNEIKKPIKTKNKTKWKQQQIQSWECHVRICFWVLVQTNTGITLKLPLGHHVEHQQCD